MRLALLLALTLVACDGADSTEFLELAELPTDQAATPVLAFSGTCPGPMTISLSGLPPFGPWALAVSPNLAPGVAIPGGSCAGLALRVGPPTMLGASGVADGAGNYTMPVTLGPGACGWWVQPVDAGACITGFPMQVP